MTCFSTLYAWRSDTPNPNGKHALVFNAKKSIDDESCMQVPCGRCLGCASDKSRIWSIRMYHELSMHAQSCFITLTYADDNQRELSLPDLQNFIKRLRHKTKLRYFACGEYGDQTRRPHYHMVCFGADFLGMSYKINDQLYSNKILEDIWGHGSVVVAPVSFGAICYVAGYVTKKIGKDDGFQVMSRKPGLGKSWLDKYRQELVNNGFVVVDGKRLDIPPQYLKWYEYEFEEVKEKRKENVRRYTTDQLAARKANLKSKLKLKSGHI